MCQEGELFKLIAIILIIQHTSIRIYGAILSSTVAEYAGEERVNTQLIVVADGQSI
jgi:hypothetical protein